MNSNVLKVIHFNLQYSVAVTDDLLRIKEKEPNHVALIQELWLLANKVFSIRLRNYYINYTKYKIRKYILVGKVIKLFLLVIKQ